MLENIKVGQKVNYSDFLFENKDIVENDDIYKRINGKSYKKNGDISLSNLTYIKMLHYNYDGNVVVGEMIVNKVILNEVKEVFSSLFMMKYQINSMRLIDDFWLGEALDTDRNSVSHNNSSCKTLEKVGLKFVKETTLSNGFLRKLYMLKLK